MFDEGRAILGDTASIVHPTSVIYGVDFGTGAALAIHGPNGPVSKRDLALPRVKGGRTPAMEFVMVGVALLVGSDNVAGGDIVVETATIGASGCEVDDVVDLLTRVPDRRLLTISCHAVKNFRLDHKLPWKKTERYAKDWKPLPQTKDLDTQENVHVEDAEIIYRIATEYPKRLYHWTGPSTPCERIHTSVRPMDKRGYRDERAEGFMALLPPYSALPQGLRVVLGNDKDYSRSIVMPFAMASTEPWLNDGILDERRRRYEKLIGLYDRGYPSFYRRATIVWMQANAKALADVTRIEEVSPVIRKEAWRLTQRQIREFFHLTMQHQGR